MSRSPKSILDAPEAPALRARARSSARSRRGRRAGVVSLVVGALVLASYAGYTAVNGSRESSSLGEVASASGENFVDVLVDGWSLKTLGDRPVTFTWSDGRTGEVTFAPVSGADLDEVLSTTPRLVQVALARELTPALDLKCTSDGCAAGGQVVDVHDLLLGGTQTAPAALRAHGVTSGLLRARIAAPAEGGTVTLTAPGYSTISLAAGAAGASSKDVTADLTNGFARGRWLIAAGLGQLFIPDPAWLGSPVERVAVAADDAGDLPADAVAQVTARASQTVASTGLGAPLDVAAQWTPSQLTLATSPSVGCDVGVLCFPGELVVTSVVQPTQVVSVTSDDGRFGVVVSDDRVVDVVLPAPINQSGIDGPLTGSVSVRFVTATLFAGGSASAVDWMGNVSVGDTAAYSVTEILGHGQLSRAHWIPSS